MLKTTDLRKHVLYLHQLLLETFSVYRKYQNSLSVTFDIACQPATHTHTATPLEFHIITHIETCIICCWNTILFPDLTPQLLDHLLNAVLFLKVASGGSYQVSLEIPIFSSFSQQVHDSYVYYMYSLLHTLLLAAIILPGFPGNCESNYPLACRYS
jgi:hypothetical protein